METTEQYIQLVEEQLSKISYPVSPDLLYAPIRYELSLGGKRIRPVLTLMGAEVFGVSPIEAMNQALGVEIFHNFTLLHDDVMDNADMRRGKPVVHKVWSENTAILSGDAMQILAYRYIAQAPDYCLSEVLRVFSKTAMEICEGQQFDMEFEQRSDVTEDEYIDMIRLKTAVLLGGALHLGALIAKAPAGDCERLYRFGEFLGLAFQLKDDYLDVYGDPKIFGKNIGGDILNNKKTYMLINALRLAQGDNAAELQRWLRVTNAAPAEKISAVTRIYNEVGVDTLCRNKMQEYYLKAIEQLDALKVADEQKIALRRLADELMAREK